MTYLITAATGTIGGATLRALRKRGERVRAVSRSERTWPEGVEGVVADLDDAAGWRDAAAGVSGAFLMSGYASEAAILEALPADARVVLLSSSAAPSEDTTNPVVKFHVESERAVAAAGRPWTILQPNSFMANALRWQDQLAAGDVVRAPFADVPVAMVDPADIGAVAATALTEDGHAGRRYRLSGPEALLPAEQLEQLGAALGRDLRLDPLPDDEAGDDFVEIFRGGLSDETTVQLDVERVLGRSPGTFAAWAASHADAF